MTTNGIINKIPIALIIIRLILGFLVIIISVLKIQNYNIIAVSLLLFGLLTDIFDGIIARKLNISTQFLRRMDSSVDQVFFISMAIATYIQCPIFFENNSSKLTILIGFEILTYIVSFLKFRKEIATHSIGAKIWTLVLFATLVEIILNCESGLIFTVCFWLGIITRIEIISIILVLKTWTNDVPSLYHAIRLRQGKEIKRNKIFNG
ncbi:CDP-alcohol phosphatidyltransferase family protein [Lacihabitans sp. LS3-19]|uniref:CDP-alcohol phosphatidyltransferase family protein n=1 Tax=Lacihabitans sp. LS3-19 TaxID=2487335 RepID=UPI0020CE2055|nr:CDP-alcohol phosphatidyltransferase family protein [Lacihabitans sp. LS3-19]MCP9768075.1 CDP-alcohol phosphatidyltransferase family protein [Lacihabitans sp. LS3-19]